MKKPIDLPGVFPWINKSEIRMQSKDLDSEDFLDAGSKAQAVIQGAVDGFVQLMKHDNPKADGGLIFLALQMALIQHAARISMFTNRIGRSEFTSESFAELAAEVFEEIAEWKQEQHNEHQ